MFQECPRQISHKFVTTENNSMKMSYSFEICIGDVKLSGSGQ